MPNFGMDAQDKRTDLFLSASVLNRLAKFQSEQVRNHYMQCQEKRERITRIDEITKDTLDKLSKEKFAFFHGQDMTLYLPFSRLDTLNNRFFYIHVLFRGQENIF